MDHPPITTQRGPQVPLLRQILNGVGCLLILPLYYYLTAATRHPLTLDLLLTILAAEYNRFTNERRRRRLYCADQYAADPEKPRVDAHTGPDCMAAVVGYREDPGLFARALNSYRAAEGCRFMLVGIDGDEPADMEMVRVFQSIHPTAPTIHLDEPFGDLAMRTYDKLATADLHSSSAETYQLAAIAHCCELAREILASHELQHAQALCIYQPHHSKKAIMFTGFIFSLVIADTRGIEYLWSSDSDTLVYADSLRRTVETIAGDSAVGGASSGLLVHNAADSAVAQLGRIVYWCELYLTRSVATAAGTSDCQSGPSSAFRVAALPGILYPWYTQMVMGHRMIVNEDRHLTTNLLLRGWTVTYVSDTVTATDTPTTLRKWILQQVRWSRSGHIESLQSPSLYLLTSPLFFWAAIKREAGPLLGLGYILYYLCTGASLAYFSWTDLFVRLLYTILYNLLRNPDRWARTQRPVLWGGLVPALLFYNVPLPMVHFWSAVTVMEDGWGTSMRSKEAGVVPDVNELGVAGQGKKEGERVVVEPSLTAEMWKRWKQLGFFVVWMGVVAGVAARILAGHLGYEVWQTERAVWGAVVVGFAGTFYGLVVRE
ncbi:chitin synthase [Aspergillus saccharolyticus JOP 1030-1]|uniref:Chitin synthase n=1 Tax=Aspergillus saccharolyticus JOP 1030-1 TaxID=1450539 RepID=A0A319AH46_9EURO|nr:chitin synthase [Aspergillus saccharolyticus JOP 1030-1]PYH45952.1 chitin synthase [Aspergillus saccharolyticus JOP 1030-1]